MGDGKSEGHVEQGIGVFLDMKNRAEDNMV